MPDLVSKLREVIAKGKVGWMDSTDFSHELGYALGGNKVYPDAEDCTKAHPCIAIPDAVYPCTAKRVIVFDADELESLLGLEGQAAREITPEMMSHVFAKSVNNTDPEHGHIYDHRIAAAELNRMLASQPSPSTPIVPGTAGLSAEQVREVIGDPNMKYNQRVADRLNALLRTERPAPAGEVKD